MSFPVLGLIQGPTLYLVLSWFSTVILQNENTDSCSVSHAQGSTSLFPHLMVKNWG